MELERYPDAGKFNKPERELLAYLELHPGTHNLAELEAQVAKASGAARALARRQVLTLRTEPLVHSAGHIRAPHTLNPHQLSWKAILTAESTREAPSREIPARISTTRSAAGNRIPGAGTMEY